MKNIVWIVVDELVASGLGCTGNSVVKTPHIDALSQRGMQFDEAYCVTPLCTPSRVSMFTGQCPHTHQRFFVDEASHVGPEVPTLVQLLKEQGYLTALIGKNHCFNGDFLKRWFDRVEEYHHWGKQRGEMRLADQAVYDWRHSDTRPGFAKFAQQGGNTVLGEGLIETPEPFPPEQCMTARIAEDAEDFLKNTGGRPFFMKYSFPDPHWPVTVCEPYYSMYSPDDIEALPGFHEIDWATHPFRHFVQSQACGLNELSEADRKRILAIYYGMITFIDDAVGRLMAALEEQGILDNTLVLFTADHGCFAGHFGLPGKTGAFYDSLVRIPLLLAGPDVPAGTHSRALVSNIDFMPTMLEYLGLPVPQTVGGRSFMPVINNPDLSHREEVFAECGIPERPPEPFPHREYAAENAVRSEEAGWFWFVDYTTKGRCAMIKRGDWKYCRYAFDTEELYNLKDDPYEIHNLAGAREHQAVRDELKSRLLDYLLHEPNVSAWRTRESNT